VKGTVVSVNVSRGKHTAKAPVPGAELVAGSGVAGDAHTGPGLRQVSLLAVESIERQAQVFRERQARTGEDARCAKAHGKEYDLAPGDFAENITTCGIDLPALPVGTRLRIGERAVIRVSKIGKECHRHCAIYEVMGDCVMPREGIFAVVEEGGTVRPGDGIVGVEASDSDDQR
jgi:MOSC domain-containing protein YiiM